MFIAGIYKLCDSLKNLQMKIESYLGKDENIERILNQKTNIPLRIEDWIKIPLSIFICFVFSFFILKSFDKSEAELTLIKYVLIFVITCFILYQTIGSLFKRWREVNVSTYAITNVRLIIFDKSTSKIKHSFSFVEFPNLTYRENAYNFGFIIIGTPEPFFEQQSFLSKAGVNLKDDEIVLYNLKNVKVEYDYLKSRIIN
jgi:hypothetical protein